MTDPMTLSLAPVSYTHLDVYKRQPFYEKLAMHALGIKKLRF